MDLVSSDSEDMSDFKRMFWGLGARIIRTAKRILRTPNWYGVHLTNFSCGADSFIEHFYRHLLREKPSLILELDEHSAVAGLLTRVEAYRNVVKNLQEKRLARKLDPDEPDSLEAGRIGTCVHAKIGEQISSVAIASRAPVHFIEDVR